MAHDEFTETFDALLKDTIPETPGIIRTLALRELRLAAREFFEKTFAWTTIINNVTGPAGKVDIVADDEESNTKVIAVLGVAYGLTAATRGGQLVPIGQKPTMDQTADASPQKFFVTSAPDHIQIFPYLKTEKTNFLDLTVALIPSFSATALPRQVTDLYYDALIDGYLSRVYLHPNKPYSAPRLAGQHRTKFVSAIGFYMAKRKQGFNNSQQWVFPGGWQVRRLGGNG
ncbi:hypothetical protein LCGC14_1217150 [marine sediment metagenome]|uniref:Uncharacterized protein n=1 Tax=marine sediment metagenome TaxID=412755 RepID=A0A0F9PGW5_9ZZZZ